MTAAAFLDAMEARCRSAVSLYSNEEMARLQALSGMILAAERQFDGCVISCNVVRPMIERARMRPTLCTCGLCADCRAGVG